MCWTLCVCVMRLPSPTTNEWNLFMPTHTHRHSIVSIAAYCKHKANSRKYNKICKLWQKFNYFWGTHRRTRRRSTYEITNIWSGADAAAAVFCLVRKPPFRPDANIHRERHARILCDAYHEATVVVIRISVQTENVTLVLERPEAIVEDTHTDSEHTHTHTRANDIAR